MKRRQLWASLATVVTLANIALPSYTVAAQGLSGNSSGEIPFSITIDEEPTVDPDVPTDPTDPTEPTDPEVPGDGETPTDPEVPGDGDEETPTDPEVPGDGETPTDPTEPTDPEIPGDGGTGETPTDPEVPTDPEIPAEPETPTESDYVITIPSGLDAKPTFDVGLEKVKLVDFEVTAQNVNLPDEQAVQVDVTAKDEYQINGKNVLKGQGNESIAYDFERDESLEYGFVDGFDDGDESSDWTIAQFRDADHEKFTDVAPVSITTNDLLILPGSYDSMLQFNVGVVDTALDSGDGTVTPEVPTVPEVPAEPEVPVEYVPEVAETVYTANSFKVSADGSTITGFTTGSEPGTSETGPKAQLIFPYMPEVKRIDTRAFSGTWMKSIDLTGLSNLEVIGEGAFDNTSVVTDIDFGYLPKLHTIDTQAFFRQAKLVDELDLTGLPNLKVIGKQAFANQYSGGGKASINLSGLSNLETISIYAFENNIVSNLNLSGLDSLMTIGSKAFNGNKLTSLSLSGAPALQSIDVGAFSGGTFTVVDDTVDRTWGTITTGVFTEKSLSTMRTETTKSFVVKPTDLTQWETSDFSVSGDGTVLQGYSPKGLAKQQMSPELASTVVFPDLPKVTSIGNLAFPSKLIQNMDVSGIPNVTSLGQSAFYNNKMTSIDLTAWPELNYIGPNALGGISTLTEIKDIAGREWNTKADGTGTNTPMTSVVTAKSNVILYKTK